MKYFTKEAKLNVADIEKRLDVNLNDELEEPIRKAIQAKEQEKVFLRSPVLKAVTLGIGPAIARKKAADEIINELAKKHAIFANAILDSRRKNEKAALNYYNAGLRNIRQDGTGPYGRGLGPGGGRADGSGLPKK
jgi:hypothetical protein